MWGERGRCGAALKSNELGRVCVRMCGVCLFVCKSQKLRGESFSSLKEGTEAKSERDSEGYGQGTDGQTERAREWRGRGRERGSKASRWSLE